MAALLRHWFRFHVRAHLDRMYARLNEQQTEADEPAPPLSPAEPRRRRRPDM